MMLVVQKQDEMWWALLVIFFGAAAHPRQWVHPHHDVRGCALLMGVAVLIYDLELKLSVE